MGSGVRGEVVPKIAYLIYMPSQTLLWLSFARMSALTDSNSDGGFEKIDEV